MTPLIVKTPPGPKLIAFRREAAERLRRARGELQDARAFFEGFSDHNEYAGDIAYEWVVQAETDLEDAIAVAEEWGAPL